VEHLATGTEAVNRRMATQASDVICSPGPGEQYLSAKRLMKVLYWEEVQTHPRVPIRFLGGLYMMEYCYLGVIQGGPPS
jgi:hypothetical protein